ncbi:helix-turn-helix domain-containing protein [Aureimonas ureilytica]|uniref:helix-turn-helix domain-containing protein n=1 Tax=Aureimonas ureilytica TaxID=401562 RepID=UPI00037113E0|nr:helix-turn-helix transcriptional regulator [Aureimonas ureilytica]
MSSALKIAVGSQVRAARKRAALTQEALADAVGRTSESISNIERGVQLPSIETLADLGRVLGIPIAEFFESVEQTPRSARRQRLDAAWRELGRALAEANLKIAILQTRVLLSAQEGRLEDGNDL